MCDNIVYHKPPPKEQEGAITNSVGAALGTSADRSDAKNMTYEDASGFKVGYKINTDGSGVDISNLTFKDIEYDVKSRLEYVKWNFGQFNPGVGQEGVYLLGTKNGKMTHAIIKDYRAFEGAWRFEIVSIADTLQKLASNLEGIAIAQWRHLGKFFEPYLSPDLRGMF